VDSLRLLRAAESGDAIVFGKMLRRTRLFGDRSTHVRLTAILLAVDIDNLFIVSALLQSGVDVNTAGYAGWRPIHFAARRGSLSMVELLLKYQAGVDHETASGQTAISLCPVDGLQGNPAKVLDRLQEAMANPTRLSDEETIGNDSPALYNKSKKSKKLYVLGSKFMAAIAEIYAPRK